MTRVRIEVKKAAGGRGAGVVLDAIGGPIGEQALQATADGCGRLGVHGFASGTRVPLDNRRSHDALRTIGAVWPSTGPVWAAGFTWMDL